MNIKSNKLGFELNIHKNIYNLKFDNNVFTGKVTRGNDAIWIPYDNKIGLKIILDKSVIDNVKYIKSLQLDIFPIIYDFDLISGGIAIFMENILEKTQSKLIGNESWIPDNDKDFIEESLSAPLVDLTKASKLFIDHDLVPEDEWYKKNKNFINSKIVDFHMFKHFPKKYRFQSNGVTPSEMSNIYKDALNRYSKMISNGVVKWKGKIYEGYRFDNGYDMVGYSSDGKYYDSYLKLNFVSFNKSKNKNVLDIGSNQGFFCFQAANHGAKKVIGLEITKEDIMLSNDINNKIFKFDNVEFIQGDAYDYIMNDTEEYGLIIFSSTLHQMFPHFKGADKLMSKLSSMSNYMHFETSVNHPLMKIPLTEIYSNLKRFYRGVRLTYVYNAYSSGYRAEFLCMNF